MFADTRIGRLNPTATDVPGGYEIESVDAGWLLTLYDESCVPMRLLIGKDGKPVPAERSGSNEVDGENPAG